MTKFNFKAALDAAKAETQKHTSNASNLTISQSKLGDGALFHVLPPMGDMVSFSAWYKRIWVNKKPYYSQESNNLSETCRLNEALELASDSVDLADYNALVGKDKAIGHAQIGYLVPIFLHDDGNGNKVGDFKLLEVTSGTHSKLIDALDSDLNNEIESPYGVMDVKKGRSIKLTKKKEAKFTSYTFAVSTKSQVTMGEGDYPHPVEYVKKQIERTNEEGYNSILKVFGINPAEVSSTAFEKMSK